MWGCATTTTITITIRVLTLSNIPLLFSTSLLKYNDFFAFVTRFIKIKIKYCVPFYIPWTFFLSLVEAPRSDMAWMIFLFNHGGSLDCFTRLWRTGACILTTSINSLYHTARASLESVSSWCTLPNGVQIRSAKNAVLVKMFKRSKHLCMPFGFWFWQFDRYGAANRVTYGD